MNGNDIEILLVEDNADDLDMALHALRKGKLAGRIQIARDGAEALDFLFGRGLHVGRRPEHGPKLILLDLKLPKVDGLEVLKCLKADPRTRHIPVVVLTSSQEPKDVAACYRLGANSYIVKPVGFDQFYAAIQQLAAYWLNLNHPPAPA